MSNKVKPLTSEEQYALREKAKSGVYPKICVNINKAV